MSNGDIEEQPLSESFSQSKKTHKLSRGSAAEMKWRKNYVKEENTCCSKQKLGI